MIKNLIRRAYFGFLSWKWDREFLAAERRMRGCAHERTMFVNVGTITEKCVDCWALRILVHDEIGRQEIGWTPNSASPKKAIRVGAP